MYFILLDNNIATIFMGFDKQLVTKSISFGTSYTINYYLPSINIIGTQHWILMAVLHWLLYTPSSFCLQKKVLLYQSLSVALQSLHVDKLKQRYKANIYSPYVANQ